MKKEKKEELQFFSPFLELQYRIRSQIILKDSNALLELFKQKPIRAFLNYYSFSESYTFC